MKRLGKGWALKKEVVHADHIPKFCFIWKVIAV